MKLRPIQWAILFGVLTLALCLLSGCEQGIDPLYPDGKSTPVLISQTVEHVQAADAKLAEAEPLIVAVPVAAEKVKAARVDLGEALKDGGAGVKQAAKDATAKADVDAALVKAKANEPQPEREMIRWLSLLVAAFGVVFAVGAWFAPTMRAKLIGASTLCGLIGAGGFVFAGVFATIVSASKLIIWVCVGLVCIGVALFGWHLWSEYRAKKALALAEATKAKVAEEAARALASARADSTSIAQSFQTAMKAKLIPEFTQEAKEVLREIQTDGAAAVVNEVQGKLPTAAVAAGAKP